jgi:hypothetical protein
MKHRIIDLDADGAPLDLSALHEGADKYESALLMLAGVGLFSIIMGALMLLAALTN